MLKFFKKTGQKDDVRSNEDSRSSQIVSKYNTPEFKISNKLLSFEDEGLDLGDYDSPKEKSRLSKTIIEVLSDKAALGYFIQYLESRSALQYIRCWLDIEGFEMAIQSIEDQRRSCSRNTKTDHDSLSVSTDCDSYTADSTSLCDDPDKQESIKLSDKSKLELNTSCDKDSESSPKFYKSEKLVHEFTEDALRVFKKFIALEAAENINCPEDIRKEVIENICSSNKICTSECFKKIQEYVYDVMEKEYFEGFLASDYFCKHQIDVLTSGNVSLEDILYNETACFYFMEFLEQEESRNLLEFWLAANNFHQQMHSQKDLFDPIDAQSDAVVLYDKYFSLQAHSPLGFSDKIRFAVEQNICGENGLMHDCFHLPQKIVEQVLEKTYLKPFLSSQLFYKYLSELISTVQSSEYCMNERNNRLSSDCSSEKSFSVSSSIFNSETLRRHKKKSKSADMTIDVRQLYDPDALWKRKKFHRLSFGHVTELGKFVTDIEPEPDKNNLSTFKNVVKRIVNLDLEEHKRKEELAWQVAEMIVKDITNVTLNVQKP